MEELRTRAVEAVARYLEHRGYEVVDIGPGDDGGPDVVARDEDGTIAMVDVTASAGAEGGLPDDAPVARERLESAAARWLAAHPGDVAPGAPVRFDSVSLMALGESRAFLRHRIGVLGTEGAVA